MKFTQYWCCFQKSTANDFIEDECHGFKYNPFSLEKSVNTPDNKRKPTLKIDTLETVKNTPIESRKFTITDSATVITESIYGEFITPPTPHSTPESIPAVIGFIPKHLTKKIENLNTKILMNKS
ncbi:MAG: hypothetical protein ACMX3H_08395 [Sodalis sp. (in: enterobacteria)]|uniref:hypothetical protein n=1 Tax=Sodalis sp. (in: enterobacteria) TaxID=1898979 RepID=UPI0039E63984